MSKLRQMFLMLTLSVFTFQALACTSDGKEGILPENNWKIPVGAKGISSITEQQFNAVIDKVEKIYAPIVASKGGKLEVQRNWSNGTVNAYAQRMGNKFSVSMFGGLARHKAITLDGFTLVLCHEIGHHIGGAPKKVDSSWASNEGQSDYFGTLKCLRNVFEGEDNRAALRAQLRRKEVPTFVAEKCRKSFTLDHDIAICERSSLAGLSLANLFAALRNIAAPKYETPDSKVVTSTFDGHPAAQCRLDTYFQGALCDKDTREDVSNSDATTGTCNTSLGDTSGVRPLCWYKPKA